MSSVKKAVIVAAGLGSRLGSLTESIPKCLLKIGEESIIERSIRLLKKQGIEDIGIVVGYKKEVLQQHLGDQYTYIFNPFYRETNNMGSLWFAKDFIGNSDFIYSHADVVYDERILEMTVKAEGKIVLTVEEKQCDEEAMKVRVDENLSFRESSKDIPLNESFGEWTGLAKFENESWKKYLEEVESLLYNREFQVYDTKAMNQLNSKYRDIIEIVSFKDFKWVEVDFENDLRNAIEYFEVKE
ncbi:NTP transferase domain-containing protein [Defluviitalea raffinosedens]|uniref:NTP transferase domain-containing protein n=1 Tax=Defluviitalea raffinosedens TaxID=1450156 RepID=A0A7C8LQF6_9FIRM|nr:phosphocholine cytidylyltransferase family protein [Defluviitalea raffinosedens]KAE9634981.1 NTP transferase domain-containing protein [Defluviitalea raffinosedens]